jgi:hypothetical protein
MNSGLKQVAKKVLSSTNPEQVAMKMMDAYVGKNPQYASLWEQAKKMAESGNAKEKAANMFAERGVDIDNVVDSVMKEIK